MAKYIHEKEKRVARSQAQLQLYQGGSSSGPVLHAADLNFEQNSLWRQHIHDELLWELQNTAWLPLVCQIHQLVLQYLQVNVQNCYCPCGCQREVGWALGWLCEWESKPPKVLVVSGTRSKEEREDIERVMEKSVEMEMKLKFGRALDGAGQ